MRLDVEFGEVWSGMVMWAVKCSGVLSWKIESLDLLGSLKIRGRLSMGLFWWLIPDLQLWMLIIVHPPIKNRLSAVTGGQNKSAKDRYISKLPRMKAQNHLRSAADYSEK